MNVMLVILDNSLTVEKNQHNYVLRSRGAGAGSKQDGAETLVINVQLSLSCL